MQNKENVYFLTVKQAEAIATKHSDDAEWDIWADTEAQSKGMSNTMEKAS